jgi:NADH-quinone oxidoreductase subunit E
LKQPEEKDIQAKLQTLLFRFPRQKRYLIAVLQALQEDLGYIPPEALKQVAKHLRMSPSELFGVVTFYTQFRLTPPGRHLIRVCRGTACHVRGGVNVRQAVERELAVKPGGTTHDQKFTYEAIACFGACALAPVVVIDETVYGHMTQGKIRRVLAQVE